MNFNDKIIELRNIADKALKPLIDSDYVLLDLPYYDNIGDSLIWEGTREFLREIPYKCLYYASKETFRYRKLSKNVIILLQGGGNFGDLYRRHSDFRMKILSLYPNNKIIILPQSVYYEKECFVESDAKAYSLHKNLIICAREHYSFDYIKRHFQNKCLLVPDMAFFIDIHKCKVASSMNRVLYLKRIDKELVSDNLLNCVPSNAEVHDWPTYEKSFKEVFRIEKLSYKVYKLLTLIGVKDKYRVRVDDWKRNYFYRKFYLRVGIDFLSPYSIIYTTRLHVMILGILLGKNLYLINNSSGKVVNYYETWLKDLDKVNVITNG